MTHCLLDTILYYNFEFDQKIAKCVLKHDIYESNYLDKIQIAIQIFNNLIDEYPSLLFV